LIEPALAPNRICDGDFPNIRRMDRARLDPDSKPTRQAISPTEDSKRLAWIYSAIPEAAEFRKRAPSLLSGGQQKLVALARALMAGTEVLLLDEPTEGIAPVLQQRMRMILKEISRSGSTVLIVESNTKYLSTLADQIFFIERGKLTNHQT